MNAVNKLLDKARKTCSLSSDAALAQRLDLSRQQISNWRKGRDTVPDEQIAKIARVANADAGEWLILIESEQAKGEARRAYGSLVKRLGIAALLGLVALPAFASSTGDRATGHCMYYAKLLDVKLHCKAGASATPTTRWPR